MATVRDRQTNALGAMGASREDVAVSDAEGSGDDDFGDLQVFDSNAVQAPYSSQAHTSALGQSSDAQDDSMETPMPKRSKSDKKEKKKHSSGRGSKSEEKSAKKKHGKSRRRSSRETDEDPMQHEPEMDSTDLGPADDRYGDSIVNSTKKKRRLSDSGEKKKSKKRKSHRHGEDIAEEAQEMDEHDHASPRDGETAIHHQGKMDDFVDHPPGHNGSYDVYEQQVVENLAREAWNEHVNSSARTSDGAQIDTNRPRAPEAAMMEIDSPSGMNQVNDAPASPEPVAEPSSTAARRRSAKSKKAKPTYFEQPLEMEDEDPYPARQLPSPSAMTPKPRNREKEATRKPKRPGKLSRSMRGGSDGLDEAGRSRNRVSGYRQGRFADDEFDAMKRAVEAFRAEHDLSQFEVNQIIQAPGGTNAGELHAELWVRIFAECPNRYRQKIINVARKNFHNFVARGTWTTEQEAELGELISIHGTKWSKIAGLINRHPEDLRDRYRNYIVCGTSQRKDAWDETEEKRLTQYVIEAMEAIDELRKSEQNPNPDLMMKSYEELIDWQNISERMDRTRSRLQCITKWKSLNIRTHGRDKLVSNDPNSHISFGLEKARRQIASMPEEERYRLILAIHGTAAGSENKIPWQKLLNKQYRNAWHRSTQLLLWLRLKHTVPDWEKKTVRDCAQYLVDHYDQTGGLPEVAHGDFDDAEEMSIIATVPHPRRSEGGANNHATMSNEFVKESDGEEEITGNASPNGLAGVETLGPEDIQIDPALMQSTPSAPTTAATPASKGSRKKASKAKKSLELSQDPIMTDDAPQPGEIKEQDSEIDEERPHMKKTSHKVKKSGKQQSQPFARADDDSDSAMDDMEDLPSRIAA